MRLLTAALEEARRRGKRQAAPFRKTKTVKTKTGGMMQLTIALPDEMGRRIRKMRDPDGFITRAIGWFKAQSLPARTRDQVRLVEKTDSSK